MKPNTHLLINADLCGTVVSLREGEATASLTVSEAMRVDDLGLSHGSFSFGLADYAAMLSVNDPNVVLGSADVKFLAPTQVGDVMVATAKLVESKGKKRVLSVSVVVGEREVLSGTLVAFVLEKHVLA